MNTARHANPDPAPDLDGLVVDRVEEGLFHVGRQAFTSSALFEREMQRVFESQWVFVGIESEIAQPHDYLTTSIGRQPVVVSRDGDGRLHAFYNACRHRGLAVFPLRKGHQKFHTCRYHGWVYDSAGRNAHVSDKAAAAYPQQFATQDHDLTPLARFDSYRGFMFASLSDDVLPLQEHLGEAKFFLDLVADQASQGLEYADGAIRYTYDGNWKLQIENACDNYHFAHTHMSYVELLAGRGRSEMGGNVPPKDGAVGSISFGRGHAVVWRQKSRASDALLRERRKLYREGLPESTIEWASSARNLTIFPNMQIVDNVTSLMLREIVPLAVDKTEMRTHCLAPRGESSDVRRARIRDYEDFFNPSGLATPDDNVMYERCQTGYQAVRAAPTQGYLRGIAALQEQQTHPLLAALDLRSSVAVTGSRHSGDETVFHDAYRHWAKLLRRP